MGGRARMPALPQRPALTPPPQPGCARPSSGNTMEAVPQHRPRPRSRPRPGGAAAAAATAASPLPPPPPPPEQERKLEQEKLSGVVKSVHRRLRKKYREGNRGGGGGGRRHLRAAQLPSPPEPARDGTGRGAGGEPPCRGGRRGAAPPAVGGSSEGIGVSSRGRGGGPVGSPLSRWGSGGGRLDRGPLPKGVCRGGGGGLWLGAAPAAAPGSLPAPARATGAAAAPPRSPGRVCPGFAGFRGLLAAETPSWLGRGQGTSLGAFPVGRRRGGSVWTDNERCEVKMCAAPVCGRGSVWTDVTGSV